MFVNNDYGGKEKGVVKSLLDILISWGKQKNVS